ncbi:hypothetical protein C8R44DRAFT_805470 [Mycena epipterygia]|nr:hypothetical protein C8R44DRAFT_805470 [Mycena epipterygia]
MFPRSGPNASSEQVASVPSLSPTSTTSQRVSSQAAASSVKSSSTLMRPQSISSIPSPSNFVPFPTISPSQIPSHESTDARVTPLSHRPAIIAAISASAAAILLLMLFVLSLYCRRRSSQKRLRSIASRDDPFLQDNAGEAKKWKDSPRSPHSSWSEELSTWTVPIPLNIERVHRGSFSTKGPHYTVRSRANPVSDVYGFGQDVVWQEAHYEDPLPAVSPPIDIIPPTPPSGIIYHNTASAMPLLRGHSAASSISSQYSTASMGLPDFPEPHKNAAPPSPVFMLERPLSMDDKDWIVCTHGSPPGGQGVRRLI